MSVREKAVVNLCNLVVSLAVEVSDLPCSVSSIVVSFVRCSKIRFAVLDVCCVLFITTKH